MKSKCGTLYVFSGPSGVGKGTIISRILADRGDVWESVSATTRAPREGEINGESYYFMDRSDFEREAEAGQFLEWACYAGNLYGTPRRYVEEHLDAGIDVILEIEVQGAMQVRKSEPSAVLIFIEPPSIEELKRRLAGRGTESAEVQADRLQAAIMELSCKMEYDIVFVNDDIDVTVAEIEGFMDANRAEKALT